MKLHEAESLEVAGSTKEEIETENVEAGERASSNLVRHQEFRHIIPVVVSSTGSMDTDAEIEAIREEATWQGPSTSPLRGFLERWFRRRDRDSVVSACESHDDAGSPFTPTVDPGMPQGSHT